MKIPTIDKNAAKKEPIDVSPEIFGKKDNQNLMAQAFRVYLSRQRKAKAKAKTRSLVIGSGAKIWRQKGTGHARHGNRKAPLFVGGGVAHGPTGKENFKLGINTKSAKNAVAVVLSGKLKDKKIFVVSELEFKCTKDASLFINEAKKSLGLAGSIAFLLSPADKIGRYLKNIAEVSVLKTSSINSYQLFNNQSIFLTKDALSELKKEYLKDDKH